MKWNVFIGTKYVDIVATTIDDPSVNTQIMKFCADKNNDRNHPTSFASSNKNDTQSGIVPFVAAMYRSVCLYAIISFVALGHPTLKY